MHAVAWQLHTHIHKNPVHSYQFMCACSPLCESPLVQCQKSTFRSLSCWPQLACWNVWNVLEIIRGLKWVGSSAAKYWMISLLGSGAKARHRDLQNCNTSTFCSCCVPASQLYLFYTLSFFLCGIVFDRMYSFTLSVHVTIVLWHGVSSQILFSTLKVFV